MSLIKSFLAVMLCTSLFCAAGCRSFQNAVNDDASTVKARKAAAQEEPLSGIEADLSDAERPFVNDFRRQGEIDRKKSRQRVFGF